MHSVWCTVYTVQSTLFTGIDNNYNNTREKVQQPVISQQHKIHNTTIDVRGNIPKHYYYSEVQRAYICSVHLLSPSLSLSLPDLFGYRYSSLYRDISVILVENNYYYYP